MICLPLILVMLSTQCKQQFTLLGVTNWEYSVFWIIEDVSGECHFSRLIQVSVQDSSASVIQTYFANYKETENFPQAFSAFHAQPFAQLKREGDALVVPGCRIQSPPPNDSLYNVFSFNADYVPHRWNSEKGMKGIILPTIQSRSARLLYAYPRGLYINYQLDSAFLIPAKNLLIVFTKHPSLGPGSDSMHGFFIFKLPT